MRPSAAGLTGAALVAAVAVAVAAPALAAGPAKPAAPKISFRSDGRGWYTVTVTPPRPLRVTLVAYFGCDFTGQSCKGSDVLGVKVLPRAATQRVSWGMARYWDQPAANAAGGLYGGRYKIILAIPGTKVVQSTEYTLANGD